jgi:hypothetical protein
MNRVAGHTPAQWLVAAAVMPILMASQPGHITNRGAIAFTAHCCYMLVHQHYTEYAPSNAFLPLQQFTLLLPTQLLLSLGLCCRSLLQRLLLPLWLV